MGYNKEKTFAVARLREAARDCICSTILPRTEQKAAEQALARKGLRLG